MLQIQRILFPTDFSDLSLHALPHARGFAETFGAELHVVHVVDESIQYWMALGPNSLPIGPMPDELVKLAEGEMERFVQANLSDLKTSLRRQIILGRPFSEIIRYARENRIDLIVLGTHGRGGLSHALLGSVTEKVVRKSPCPVLTIRHPEHAFVMP